MTTAQPVLFIHGLWLHATSWAAWVDLFRQAGYARLAPGWPGDPDSVEQARANPASLADHASTTWSRTTRRSSPASKPRQS
jgi:hypothetical protein